MARKITMSLAQYEKVDGEIHQPFFIAAYSL